MDSSLCITDGDMKTVIAEYEHKLKSGRVVTWFEVSNWLQFPSPGVLHARVYQKWSSASNYAAWLHATYNTTDIEFVEGLTLKPYPKTFADTFVKK